MPPKGSPGKRQEPRKSHTHNYVTTRSTTTRYTEEETGKRVEMTTNHQKCNNAGCPNPNNIEILRKYI